MRFGGDVDRPINCLDGCRSVSSTWSRFRYPQSVPQFGCGRGYEWGYENRQGVAIYAQGLERDKIKSIVRRLGSNGRAQRARSSGGRNSAMVIGTSSSLRSIAVRAGTPSVRRRESPTARSRSMPARLATTRGKGTRRRNSQWLRARPPPPLHLRVNRFSPARDPLTSRASSIFKPPGFVYFVGSHPARRLFPVPGPPWRRLRAFARSTARGPGVGHSRGLSSRGPFGVTLSSEQRAACPRPIAGAAVASRP